VLLAKIVEVYEKHGTLRHPNKSLYPSYKGEWVKPTGQRMGDLTLSS